MNPKKFVFICGLHRSGTSILFKILRDQIEVSGFRNTNVPEDEGQFLQTVFRPDPAFGGVGIFGLNLASHLDEHSSLFTQENREKLFREWSRYWDLSKPILLEKSPPNIVRTRFLQAMFPESYFLMTKRHPVAVSFATQAFGFNRDLDTLLQHWIFCHRKLESDLPHLKNVLDFKYEDFIANNQAIFDSISNFIQCKPIKNSFRINQTTNDKYFVKWLALPESQRTNLM
ncbi:sulfotransferase [Alicyclobacillus tolerans]|uniref:sulfotransferase family protein n=1 Tax=Alicyclobacillus tolerans TaxID=90970 RepID=UPI001F3C780F|nr:sulfotransferase [Alicyclobacillus tolerans]MCF8568170.1 sulfotransferase [Alicyclobacillus tolerans]